MSHRFGRYRIGNFFKSQRSTTEVFKHTRQTCFFNLPFLALNSDQLTGSGDASGSSQRQVSNIQRDSSQIEVLRNEINKINGEALPGNIQKVIQDSIALNTEEFENFRTTYSA